MTPAFTERAVEQAALAWLESVGCQVTRYEARRPDAVPAANRKLPVESRPKALGTGSVGACPAGVRRPVAGSTANPPAAR